MKTYIGVDPGLSGAIAVLRRDEPPVIYDMPVLKSGTKGRREVDGYSLGRFLGTEIRMYPRSTVAVIEKVGAMPKQGTASMFKFGFSAGIVHGIFHAWAVPIHMVTPQRWKKYMLDGQAKEKQASVAAAMRLWPRLELIPPRCRKPRDGRAEAALIAEYGRSRGFDE